MTYEDFKTEFGFTNLNEQQEKAVQQVNGATLLLATPGSGKTTVIVARTGYMIYGAGINPSSILTLTFTKSAAEEMKARFVKKFGASLRSTPKFSTINSFCLSVIRTCQKEKGIYLPTLLPQNEPLIRQIAKGMMTDYPSNSTIKELAQKIGKAKNELMTKEQLAAIDDFDFKFDEFYAQYQDALTSSGRMDFDDQLLMAYNLLQTYPDILQRAHNTYRYVSLDEAQDTSLLQHKIVQLLVGRQGNIFMVGDEDQSIYGFRGAYPTALLNFDKDYDNAQMLYMGTNYRSDVKIVNAANQFIKRNELRNDKNMRAFSSEKGTINVKNFKTMGEQQMYCLRIFGEYLNKPDETLAILARNNDSLAYLQDYIRRTSIEINVKDSAKTFLGDATVCDLLCLLKFATDPSNKELFGRIYYKLGLYTSRTIAEQVINFGGDNLLQTLADFASGRLGNDAKYIADVYKKVATQKPADALKTILYSGYQEYLERRCEDGGSEQSALFKANTLVLMAKDYDTIPEFLQGMSALQKMPPSTGNNVTLSTIHSSKGLEFDHVIIIDILKDVLPATNPMTATQEEIEEEARLFYVGATRAKHTLELVTASGIGPLDLDQSEYLISYEHLDENGHTVAPQADNSPFRPRMCQPADKSAASLHKLSVNERIVHPAFGSGTITGISASGILICVFDKEPNKPRQFLKTECEKRNLLIPENQIPHKTNASSNRGGI